MAAPNERPVVADDGYVVLVDAELVASDVADGLLRNNVDPDGDALMVVFHTDP